MNNKFWVLKDAEGNYRPKVFIVRDGNNAKIDVEYFIQEKEIEEGDKIVLVELLEIKN